MAFHALSFPWPVLPGDLDKSATPPGPIHRTRHDRLSPDRLSMSASAIVRSLTRRDSGGEAPFPQYHLPEQFCAPASVAKLHRNRSRSRVFSEPGLIAGGGPLCGPQQKADSGLLPSWPTTGYPAPPSRCTGSCESTPARSHASVRGLWPRSRRSSPSCHKARRSSFVRASCLVRSRQCLPPARRSGT